MVQEKGMIGEGEVLVVKVEGGGGLGWKLSRFCILRMRRVRMRESEELGLSGFAALLGGERAVEPSAVQRRNGEIGGSFFLDAWCSIITMPGLA